MKRWSFPGFTERRLPHPIYLIYCSRREHLYFQELLIRVFNHLPRPVQEGTVFIVECVSATRVIFMNVYAHVNSTIRVQKEYKTD